MGCQKIRWETIQVKEQTIWVNNRMVLQNTVRNNTSQRATRRVEPWCQKIRYRKNKSQWTTTVLQWRPRWTVATGHLATSGSRWNFDTERAFFFCPMLLWHPPKRKGCGWCFWLPSIVSLSPIQKQWTYFSQWCTLQGQKSLVDEKEWKTNIIQTSGSYHNIARQCPTWTWRCAMWSIRQ